MLKWLRINILRCYGRGSRCWGFPGLQCKGSVVSEEFRQVMVIYLTTLMNSSYYLIYVSLHCEVVISWYLMPVRYSMLHLHLVPFLRIYSGRRFFWLFDNCRYLNRLALLPGDLACVILALFFPLFIVILEYVLVVALFEDILHTATWYSQYEWHLSPSKTTLYNARQLHKRNTEIW